MQALEKVKITNRFHAYHGQIGIISRRSTDEDGDIILVVFDNGEELMLEPSDVEVV